MIKYIMVFSFLFIGSASAQSSNAQYSIPWFEMSEHSGARQEAITLCRKDHRFYENKDTRAICSNAETAESRVYSKRVRQGLNALNTVEWWKDNRDLRASALKACERRAAYDLDMLQYCDLAREAEKQSLRRVRG